MPRFSLLDAAAWTALAVVFPGVVAWISSELYYFGADDYFASSIREAKSDWGRWFVFGAWYFVPTVTCWVGLTAYRGLALSKVSPPLYGRVLVWDGSVALFRLVECQAYSPTLLLAKLMVAFIELAGFAFMLYASRWIGRWIDGAYDTLGGRAKTLSRYGFVAASLAMAGIGWEGLRYWLSL